MKSRKFLSILLLLALSVSGCAQQIRPPLRTTLGAERIFDKNYEIGQKLAAYVGQPIIKVKDYKVNRFSSKYMQASDDFTISGGIVTITGSKNTDYAVRGETTIDGKGYTVVSLPDQQLNPRFGVLVNPDGSPHSKLLNHNIPMIYSFEISPPELKFIPSKDEEIDVGSGFLNYELVYGGTDGKSITITYREYTSNDLARPAFFQNLVYEAGKNQIRFKDTVIQVEDATNERIIFTVLSDGL